MCDLWSSKKVHFTVRVRLIYLHCGSDVVKVKVSRICPKSRNTFTMQYIHISAHNWPNSRYQHFGVQGVAVLAVHFHARHKDLLPKYAHAIVLASDVDVVAGSQTATDALHAEAGEDEHDHDHQNGHQQDLLVIDCTITKQIILIRNHSWLDSLWILGTAPQPRVWYAGPRCRCAEDALPDRSLGTARWS